MSSSLAPTPSKGATRQNSRGSWGADIYGRLRTRSNKEYRRVANTSLQGVATLIALIASGMTFFGCIMVLSASSVEMISLNLSPFSQATRQIQFGLIGLVLMFVVGFVVPVKFYRSTVLLNTSLIIVLIALSAVMLVGVEVNGNRNWLSLGGVQVQPSELAKIVVILWAAMVLKNQGDISVGVSRALFPLLVGVAPVVGLILAGHDVGTVIVYGLIIFFMLWVGGMNRRLTLGLLLLGSLAGIGALMSTANRRARVLALFGQCDGAVCDQSNSGLAALASGGFWGVGLGRSRQKYNYLPEPHNDFIFAVIGEELGLIGSMLTLLFFLGIIYCAVRIIARSADRFIQLATAGILAWFIGQALVNISMVTGLAPVIGVPLPFISYGGSSLVSSLVAAGVLIGFARHTPLKPIAGGQEIVIPLSTPTKDAARRAKLAEIVNKENEVFRKRNWAPTYDFWDILGRFGLGKAADNRQPAVEKRSRTAPSGSGDSRPRNRVRAEQGAQGRNRGVPVQASKVKPVTAFELQDWEEAESAPARKPKPTQQRSMEAVKNAPVAVEKVADAPRTEAELEPAEAPQRQAEPVRKLPPGLAPVKQIRARQQQKGKRS